MEKGRGRNEAIIIFQSPVLWSVIIQYWKTIQKRHCFCACFTESLISVSCLCITLIFPPPLLSYLTVYLSPPTSRPFSASAVETSQRSRPTTNPSRLTRWKNQPPNRTAPPFEGQKVSRYSRPIAARGRRSVSPTDEMPGRPWGSTHSASVLAASRRI